ncbi:MAG: hypothetical protein B6241_11880 [Spirochaetaceae bacterium 4572_59]|nr:MAG: hypothetical protein B6241_11880 [Spirochaetaceae bacterium 4572_59]
MSEMDLYLRDLTQSKEFPFGELKIGAPPEFGKAYLSSIIANYQRKHYSGLFKGLLSLPQQGRLFSIQSGTAGLCGL